MMPLQKPKLIRNKTCFLIFGFSLSGCPFLRLQSLNSSAGSGDIIPGRVPNMAVQVMTQFQVRDSLKHESGKTIGCTVGKDQVH